MNLQNKTNFLFVDPSFLGGVAKLVDFNGSLNKYNESVSGVEADSRALKKDWEAVGGDIQNSIEKYEQEKK